MYTELKGISFALQAASTLVLTTERSPNSTLIATEGQGLM